MDNRFKFRAWDEKHNCYDDDISPCYFDVDGFVVEQCTGLKDKNGNLIYEGDKVEISVYGDIINEGFVEKDTQHQGIVVWVKQGFYVKVADNFFYIPEDPEDIEIIGNVHENKGE